MHRHTLAALLAAALLSATAFAGPNLGWKLLDPTIPSNVTKQIRIQLVDGSGHAVPQAVSTLSVRVDMGPDAMADMTAPAKVSAGNVPGLVLVETNLYAPGRWAVIVSGTAKSGPVKGTVVVTAKP